MNAVEDTARPSPSASASFYLHTGTCNRSLDSRPLP